ncbi:MAG: multiprotein bridging factor aMBF1 [Candidatus Woesearchaeota archaeon]|nr:multiprotein bridging factor aMBF1 [Candidatus Woesearchaeota archaeon]
MASCDMCGSEKPLNSVFVEGTTLQVCASCSRYGKALPKPTHPVSSQQPSQQRARQHMESETNELLVDTFASLIKQAREKLGMQHKDLAQAAKEKESVIQHIESGKLKPSLPLAQRLEKILHITLVELYIPPANISSSQDNALTIGDLVKIRKKT